MQLPDVQQTSQAHDKHPGIASATAWSAGPFDERRLSSHVIQTSPEHLEDARGFFPPARHKEKREAEALALGMMLRLWPAVSAVPVDLVGIRVNAAVGVGEVSAMRAALDIVIQEQVSKLLVCQVVLFTHLELAGDERQAGVDDFVSSLARQSAFAFWPVGSNFEIDVRIFHFSF